MPQPVRGLALAREKGWLLAWGANEWLYLFDQHGKVQAQVRTRGQLAAACCSDDGSAYAASSARGEIWWLTPDLTITYTHVLPRRAVAVALDPFGRYIAAADAGGNLHFLDRHGRQLCQVRSPRPLHHLAFVPGMPYLVGCSDYGLVGCLDLTGRWVWRDGLVSHIGSLTVSGDGEPIILACFTEGLQLYSLSTKKHHRHAVSEPCRLAVTSFNGSFTLVGGFSNRLQMLDAEGTCLIAHDFEHPAIALAFGALGDSAVAAFADGKILGFELSLG
jgi:hypothetical protein